MRRSGWIAFSIGGINMASKPYTLKKPIIIDNKECAVLNYDFDDLTGADIDQVMLELGLENKIVQFPELDQIYHAALFSKAAGVDLSDVKRMSAKDYMKVGSLAKNFFFFDAEELSQQISSAKERLKSRGTAPQPTENVEECES